MIEIDIFFEFKFDENFLYFLLKFLSEFLYNFLWCFKLRLCDLLIGYESFLYCWLKIEYFFFS